MLVCCLFATLFVQAQVEYPYPLQKFNITLEGKPVKIAYMDAKPDSPNNKTVMLFHGKNFNGYYWKDVMAFLVKAGFSLPQAVMLCTLKGAEYLKRDKEVGSIEKGKAADFILIDGDLTTDVTNIRKIQWGFKDGVGYDSKTIFESVKGKVGLY